MSETERTLPEHAKFGEKQIEATVEEWFKDDALRQHYVESRGHWEDVAPVIANAAALHAYWIGEANGRAAERERVVQPWVMNAVSRALSQWSTGSSKVRFPFHLGRLVTVIRNALELALKGRDEPHSD